MRRIDTGTDKGFRVLAKTMRSEAATMVLEPGSATGGPENRHQSSDQWLFVVAGKAAAVVAGREVELQPGDLLMIEAGESHEIRNTGLVPFETLNFYAPPAY